MEPIFPLTFVVPQRGSRDRMQSLLRQLADAIKQGRLREGLRLPASRELARMTGVSRNTVIATYEALIAQGLATSRTGSGTFVAALSAERAQLPAHAIGTAVSDRRLNPLYHRQHTKVITVADDCPYDFRVGLPDWRTFPWDVWRRLGARALRVPRLGLASYLDSAGPRSLREALSAQVSQTRAISCDPHNIIITAGAQQAFDLLSRVLVTRPGALVAVEDPGYAQTREAFAAAGASIVPIEVDQDGMRIATLPAEVRVISVTPSHQYPLGSQLSLERRMQLLQFARDNDAVVVEDDYDGEFRFRGRLLDALKTLDHDDRVFYIGTFSKTLFPSLRLGYVIAPAWARNALAYAKQCADLQSPTLSESVVRAFITEGHMARHLVKMRRIYQSRGERIVAGLRRHCGDRIRLYAPAAGLHLVMLLPAGTDVEALVGRCANAGVAVSPLTDCWVHQPRWQMLGIGFGAIRDEDIDAGVRRFSAAAFA